MLCQGFRVCLNDVEVEGVDSELGMFEPAVLYMLSEFVLKILLIVLFNPLVCNQIVL